MLKSDLIAILVQKRGVTQKQAESTVETIFESMKDALCGGENIEIRGLGAFHVKHYEGYQGRNPKTGQVIPVKPKRGILFRTGKELRDRVNRSSSQPTAPVVAAETVAPVPEAAPGSTPSPVTPETPEGTKEPGTGNAQTG
ncbi:MAG: integration host factor subunit beta [Deltaproteobacteria bacterium]|nr:integration host factor subunit beta [Deltaproteobacteria bacterium]